MRSTLEYSSYSLGPEFTPKSVKSLIIAILLTCISVALVDPLIVKYAGFNGPLSYLGMSLYQIKNFYLWQPLTYLFVQQSYGLNIFFFINLAFQMYILWILGSSITQRFGSTTFLSIFFISGIVSGLAVLSLMALAGTDALVTGCAASLFALFTVWTMLNADGEILLFFIFPVKAKWLLAGILGISFLIFLSQGDFISFGLIFFGTLIGYLYGVIKLGLSSPYPFMSGLDDFIYTLGKKAKQMTLSAERRSSMAKTKIIDIETGLSNNDDVFVDQMLAKISATGEKSLSKAERTRLNKISEKKKKDQEEAQKKG